ncbi:MAG: type IV pilus assembly PilZ [Methylococcaceae bacterium NSP1-1]|nr:MAG: type IV pilus assembly PilZ [Methylococcaceae bacterium NSP1-1]
MYSNLDRPCRKNLTSHGLIYMGEEEHEITVLNISITGILAELNSHKKDIDVKYIFNMLLTTTIIDLYLPEMRLAGEAEVVRVDVDNDRILLALEFKNIAFDIDKTLNKRKVYRKNMPDLGQILLNGEFHEFKTVNVSVEGLMIRLSETISVEEGTITYFEFKRLELNGKVEVIWSDLTVDAETLIGLRYVNLNSDNITGIPRFDRQQTA